MASPFDISTYELLGSGKTVIDPDVLRAANRAKRVAQFGEDAVARMEAAGSTFRGGATPPSGSPTPAQPAPTTRMGRFRSLLTPRNLLKGGLVAAPAIGAFGALTAPREETAALGESVGLDPNTIPGRVGSNVLDFLTQTGNAATFGVAGRVGRVLSGGSFFDPVSGAEVRALPTEPSEAAVAPVTPRAAAPSRGFGARVSPVVQPVTGARDIRAANDFIESAAVPARGTGFLRNNQTGAIQRFEPQVGAATSVPTGPRIPSTGIGSIDAIIEQIVADLPAARKVRGQKAEAASATASAALIKALAEGNKPGKIEVIPSLDPNAAPTVVSVDSTGQRATQLPVVQPLPAGYTAAQVVAEAKAKRKEVGNDKKAQAAINARLAQFGLPPLE